MLKKKNTFSLKKIREYVLLGALFLLVAANVLYTVNIATSGAELTKLDETQNSLLSTNQNYNEQIMGSSSLSAVSAKATELGFVKPENTIYVTNVESVASLR